MTEASKRGNKLYYIHICIFLLITFGVGFLPPFAQITDLGMRVLGVFLGVIYAWCFIALDWPSLVALCALAVIGYGEGADAIVLSGWSFQTIPQLILCFLLAEGIAQTKLTKYVSDRLLSFNVFKGRPYVLVGGLLIAQIILNLLQCAYAGLFLLWGIASSMSEKAGYPKCNMFNTIVITSTVTIYVWSSFIFPFNPGALMHIAFLQQAIPGIEIPFGGWIVLWGIFTVLYAILWPIILKYVFRIDLSAIANINLDELQKEKQAMLPEQKFGIGILLGFVIAMFIPEVLPEGWIITKAFSALGLSGCLAIAVIVMVAFKKSNGEHYLTMQAAANGIQWNVIWLLVATEPLASAFNADECGILPSIMTAVTPLLTTLSPALFLVICMIVLGIVTQFVHNS